jgi:transposase
VTDAEAICEAVSRPNMRFVPVKTVEQQSVLMLHRTRSLLVRPRTMFANAIRAHLAEFGIVAAQGIGNVMTLVERLISTPSDGEPLPELVATILAPLMATMKDLQQRIKMLEAELMKVHRASEVSRRLETIPAFGCITSTAIAAAVPNPSIFRSGREFAAWLGLTPRQNSSGGKERLGGITKMGDGYIRSLLVNGAMAVIRFAKEEGSAKTLWIRKMMAKKPSRVVAVALANKMARIAWAVMSKRETYRALPA